MERSRSVILLVEANSDLRELESYILDKAGFRVETLPATADIVANVERVAPQVIVLGITGTRPDNLQALDALQADPRARKIPVVVIATSEQLAAAAKAAPVTQYAIVAPFDINTLERSVAEALGHPPPAASLPETGRPPPRTVEVATDELSKYARQIVLQSVRQIQTVEPYRSRFTELTPGLVDNMAQMFGAIADSVRHGLPPEEVFATPAISGAIEEHVRLRESQGLGASQVILEDQILRDQMVQFLVDLVDRHPSFSAMDAIEMSQRLNPYVDELIRIIVNRFCRNQK